MKENYQKIKKLINEADAILVGAGAGLSTAAGFVYDGLPFLENFAYMHDKYGYNDMYSACFHDFASSEERWGYWSKFIYLNRYQGPKDLYLSLYDLLKDKNYFVITTNVDHQFQLSGFAKDRLFYTQGDYGLFQCSTPCHNKTYDNEEIIFQMIQSLEKDYQIPTSLIPLCPICHKEMTNNLRSDDRFVEDEYWHKHAELYAKFIKENQNKKILLIELGVGFNTPGIIKYPFWHLTKQNKNAFLLSINKGQAYIPKEISERSLLLDMDIKEVIEGIKNT